MSGVLAKLAVLFLMASGALLILGWKKPAGKAGMAGVILAIAAALAPAFGA